jgi:competence protein ComGF
MSKVIDNLNDKTIEWIPFSDQVMGGISEVNFVERKENGLSYYHMEGKVSTENNGGFIQFRAEVEIDNAPYKGIKIKTRGNGEEYYLFIRTF